MAPRRTRAMAAAEQEVANGSSQLSSPPATPASAKGRTTKRQKQLPNKKSQSVKSEPISPVVAPASTRKRARASPDHDRILDELPHNLGSIPTPDGSDEIEQAQALPKKRARRSAKSAEVKVEPEDIQALAQKVGIATPADVEKPAKTKQTKKNKYGFMPGQSPYPDWPHPTPEECYEVERLLSKEHGRVKPPDQIPVPSVTVAGCGEVPSVLDALIRTRLSAATSGTNSSRAFQGLVKRFGTIKEGIGKGSVDWNAVRLASQPEVFDAIKSGGLANVKSKDIKSILQMTYEENQSRKAALKEEWKNHDGPAGSENEPVEEKKSEIARAESEVLSLDHLHLMATQDAINRMVQFPGIGAKTASCVALFCLRRSSFAVDTHVFRLCQYLGWVPAPDQVKPGEPKVSRNTAYTHCEARIPDDLKYALHQLFIKHGKTCPRCRAATSTSSERWAEGCPIDHLVKRHEMKKGGGAGELDSPARTSRKTGGTRKRVVKQPTKKGSAKNMDTDEESEEESSGLSDVGSEDDDEDDGVDGDDDDEDDDE